MLIVRPEIWIQFLQHFLACDFHINALFQKMTSEWVLSMTNETKQEVFTAEVGMMQVPTFAFGDGEQLLHWDGIWLCFHRLFQLLRVHLQSPENRRRTALIELKQGDGQVRNCGGEKS